MGVPSFTDLGKGARDVFKTGYHYGKSLIIFNVKTRSSGKFELSSDTTLHCDASKLSGNMEGKYKVKDFGALIEKWNTDGTLSVGYVHDFKSNIDLSLLSEIAYNPESSNKNLNINAKAMHDRFNLICGLSSDMNSRVNLLGSAVANVKDFLIGYQGGYNTETNKLTKNDVGLAFSFRDVAFHFRCTSIPQEFGLSVLYKVNQDWDVACNGILARNSNSQEWTVGAGAKYRVDDKSTFRFKFNSDLQFATSLQQKLDESVTLTLSFNIDCANVRRGGHKVGLALNIDA